MDAGKVFTYGGVLLILILFVLFTIKQSGSETSPAVEPIEQVVEDTLKTIG